MSRLPLQGLLPIALMLLLVGLTFWLQQATAIPQTYSDSLLRHDPDYFAERFTVNSFDASGQRQNTLVGRDMVHYPDDETTLVNAPQMTFYQGPQPTRITAEQGLIAPDGRQVELIGAVHGVRQGRPGEADVVFTTTRLTVFPDNETARTTAPVTIVQGASTVNGVGMDVDNKSRLYHLHSRVQSTIESKTRRPTS